ncbi:MAG: hypothetical protein Q9210_007621, partial [Variospora velana]
MYHALAEDAPTSKFYVSQGQLPKKIDAEQPPSKRQPFSTILRQAFTHSVSTIAFSYGLCHIHFCQAQIILPEELHNIIWENVTRKLQPLEYSRVIMPLSALLDGEFFNIYIKSGQLRLELLKETYEKVGLVGDPIRDAGRKHVKTRYGKCDPKAELRFRSKFQQSSSISDNPLWCT